MSSKPGIVYLVGAGPGDPGLITVHGLRLLRQADVVLHDWIIGPGLLVHAPAGAEIVDVGKVAGHHKHCQEEINAFFIKRARQGRTVVRLKGGDPFVFGRGWEEWRACRDAGVPCIVVPGVTSAVAAPAAAGIPVSHRGAGSAFAVVTAHSGPCKNAAGLAYDALAKIDLVVVMMGRSNLAEVAQGLIAAGRDPSTPAACIERATLPEQRSVMATLETIAAAADREGLSKPAVTVIGELAGCSEEYKAYLASIRHSSVGGRASLIGKRVLITRSTLSNGDLRDELDGLGAIPVECPMLRISLAPDPAPLDAAIKMLDRYPWIAFTSVHGVRGFFERLSALGRDARALAPCKVGAIGPIAAGALQKCGITADVVPNPFSEAALTDGILQSLAGRNGRVLCPRGNIAGGDLPEKLRQAGVQVDEVVAYQTDPATPPDAVRRAFRDGVDAVLLCSPSAARRFAELKVEIDGAVVACIGPVTANAGREAGLTVDVVAEDHTDAGIVDALARHVASVKGCA